MSPKGAVVIAEAALEPIPKEIAKDPRIISSCRKRGRSPSKCLLDKSLHYWAMKDLEDAEKRGRPDLVHFTLLSLVYSPAYMSSLIKIYVHTYGDLVIELGEGVRIPHAYFRFEGLIMDLLNKGEVRSNGNLLLSVKSMKLCELLSSLGKEVVTFETGGRPASLHELVQRTWGKGAVYVIGGFPAGSFKRENMRCLGEPYSIHGSMLEAGVVASRLAYEIEMAEGVWGHRGPRIGGRAEQNTK